MAVSVETLNGLERKITVSVPTQKIEEEVGLRLKGLVNRVKIDGFRPGKAPLHLVNQRYSEAVREEVAREMVQSSLYEALKDNGLVPAGTPEIEPGHLASGQDFSYTAFFEVFPEFTIQELEDDEIEVLSSTITDTDVDALIEKLREQNKTWESVSRPVAHGDRILLDFEGFIDGQPMEHGKAENHEMVVGSGQMIEGFDQGVIGAHLNEAIEIDVTFPSDYHAAEIAGKQARFHITVKEIKAGQLPELNDAFVELFNIKEGGIEALKKDIKENMTRELERRISSMNRERVFDAILAKNKFDVPNSLVEQEIGHLKHEMYHRIFGHEHHENEKIPDFPRELFLEQAQRRVQMGLLFADYVKKHKLEVERARVDAMIEKLATAYDNPEELKDWYQSNKERMAEIEALVMEEMVAEKMAEKAKKVFKEQSYDEVMTPKKQTEAN